MLIAIMLMLAVGRTKYIQDTMVAKIYGFGKVLLFMLRKIINIAIDNNKTSQVCAHRPLERVLDSGVANANITVINRLVVFFEKILRIKKMITTVAAVIPEDNIFCISTSLAIE